MSQKIWFITGCSTGFGRELVKVAISRGDRVAATVRKAEQLKELEALSPGNIKAFLMDVTHSIQVGEAIKGAATYFGRLDIIVNNAGYGSIGPIEEIGMAEIRRQFEVNVFGAIDVIQHSLPYLREQKSGHIINITSIAGLRGTTGMGIYNGSKFALEGIGEALAQEVKPFGIHVTNVEPGPFRTDWAGRSATVTPIQIEGYQQSAARMMAYLEDVNGKQKGDPFKGAEAIFELSRLEKPPVHLPLGGIAYERIRKSVKSFSEELDAFEYLGLPTDYEGEA